MVTTADSLAATERDFEVALRQLEQMEKIFKAQLDQLRQQLEYMKSSRQPAEIVEESRESPGVSQLQEMLDSLRTEIAGELGKKVPEVRVIRQKPQKKKKNVEFVELRKVEQPAPEIVEQASDVMDEEPDDVQEEIFSMIKEISQEKREQEKKIPRSVETKRAASAK